MRPSPSPLAGLVLATALAASGCSGGAGATRAAGPDDAGHDGSAGSVWVANTGSDSLTVLDATSGEVTATVSGIESPHNVQASADGDAVWVTGTGGVVRIGTADLAASAVAPAGQHPAHVVEDGDRVLVTSYGDGVVHSFAADLTGAGRIRTGGAPHGIRTAAQAPIAVVANLGGGTLDVIDTRTDDVVDRIRVGDSPVQSAVTADGRTAYASLAGGSAVIRVDLASRRVTGRVRVPDSPAQIYLADDGTLVSADQGTPAAPGRTVTVVDTERMRVLGSVRVGSGPHGVVVIPGSSTAWVTNSSDGTVSVVDLATRTVEATVRVGDAPNGITHSAAPATPPADGSETVTLLVPPRYAPTQQHHGQGSDEHDGGHAH